ncbi:MAG: M56 family metallopeptidase [Planctomycetota bacterium]
MNAYLLSACASNLAVSTALALAAALVQRRGTKPRVAHFLWLLVLIKLVTPPLFSLPLFELPGDDLEGRVAALLAAGSAVTTSEAVASAPAFDLTAFLANAARLAWIAGSALVLVVSLARAFRFDRRLRTASSPAPAELVATSARLARRLGLARAPKLLTTDANVAPLVWWFGGAPRVVVPRALVEGLPKERLELVLAHELAHLRRRDHVVRWIEWLACVAFWWNPVAWIARRNLRIEEEVCCDALVIASLGAKPKAYATSLLDAIELLARPVLRPPAVASAMDSGGALTRRMNMILANPAAALGRNRALGAAALLSIVFVPLGIAAPQEPDYEAIGNRLVTAVRAGEVSADQAKAMMGALASARFEEMLREVEPRSQDPIQALLDLGYVEVTDDVPGLDLLEGLGYIEVTDEPIFDDFGPADVNGIDADGAIELFELHGDEPPTGLDDVDVFMEIRESDATTTEDPIFIMIEGPELIHETIDTHVLPPATKPSSSGSSTEQVGIDGNVGGRFVYRYADGSVRAEDDPGRLQEETLRLIRERIARSESAEHAPDAVDRPEPAPGPHDLGAEFRRRLIEGAGSTEPSVPREPGALDVQRAESIGSLTSVLFSAF